jgi:putative NADH-flavin reductase
VNITVLGATGRTGHPLVEELLARGHHVTALVRDPTTYAAPDGVNVVAGHSRDAAALAAAVAGVEAVVSALGPVAKDATLHRDTARELIPVMTDHGVHRFVGVSGAGIDVPGDAKNRSARAISWAIRMFGGEVASDKLQEYALHAASDLDWTLVRPPRLTDGPRTGSVDHDAHHTLRSTTLGRADLAVFIVDVVEGRLYPRAAPFVASRKQA